MPNWKSLGLAITIVAGVLLILLILILLAIALIKVFGPHVFVMGYGIAVMSFFVFAIYKTLER